MSCNNFLLFTFAHCNEIFGRNHIIGRGVLLDDCRSCKRGGKSPSGCLCDERMAYGFGHVFLGLAFVVFYRSLLSCLGQ